MKKHLITLMSFVLLLTVIGCGSDAIDSSESEEKTDKPTITLGETPYVPVWFLNSLIKQVAEDQGYPVEMVKGDVGVIYLALSKGEVDVYPDVWTPTVHASYIEKYENDMEVIGTLYEDAPLGWAVPSYVEIDSIEDLTGREEEFENRIVGIESSAGMMFTSEEVIEGYDLDYELLGGSTIAMLSELKKATNNEEPIVFLAWRPHVMFQQFDIKLLDDPKGYWSHDDVKVGVSNQLKEKAPDVYQFLEHANIDIDDLEAAMLTIEDEQRDVDEVAKEWIEEHQTELDQWLGK